MKILTRLLPIPAALLLASCATPYVPTQAAPSINPADITGFFVEAPNRIEVTDGRQAWKVHLVGRCLELDRAQALVFTDEQAIQKWPDQPWNKGYGNVVGWPVNGSKPDRSSDFMDVSSNRLSWVHAYDGNGRPIQSHASYGCQVEEVEPLWR